MKTPMTFPQTVKELDRVFSLYIRAKEPRCVLCSAPTTDCSHLFSRVSKSTRWSEYNCHGNCRACNTNHETNPKPYTDWFIRKYGQAEYDRFQRLHRLATKFSRLQLLGMIDEYKTKLKLLKHETNLKI